MVPRSGAHSSTHEPKTQGAHSKRATGGRRPLFYVICALAGALLVTSTLLLANHRAQAASDAALTTDGAMADVCAEGLGTLVDDATMYRNGLAAQITTATQPADSVTLDVPTVTQLPELPCGCEITAATADVDYYGFDVSNVELNDFLAQGWDNYNPHEGFIGYCDSSGWMCYAEPIVAAIDSYLESIGNTTYTAADITGTPTSNLYTDYVAKGTPVIVWVTTYLEERDVMQSWDIGDEEITVSEQDHCMVLIGYTDDSVILMDPLDDRVEYPKEDFEASYDSRGDRAVAITKVVA